MMAPWATPQSSNRKRGQTACTWDVDGFVGAFLVKANDGVSSGSSHSQSRAAAPVMGHTAVESEIRDV